MKTSDGPSIPVKVNDNYYVLGTFTSITSLTPHICSFTYEEMEGLGGTVTCPRPLCVLSSGLSLLLPPHDVPCNRNFTCSRHSGNFENQEKPKYSKFYHCTQ